jgi:hypothetical protein
MLGFPRFWRYVGWRPLCRIVECHDERGTSGLVPVLRRFPDQLKVHAS